MSLLVCRRIGDSAAPLRAMEIRARLSLNLRRLRQGKGWSQEGLAHEAGLHRTYVSDLERGARNPTISVVDILAVALDVPVGQLLDEPKAGAVDKV